MYHIITIHGSLIFTYKIHFDPLFTITLNIMVPGIMALWVWKWFVCIKLMRYTNGLMNWLSTTTVMSRRKLLQEGGSNVRKEFWEGGDV